MNHHWRRRATLVVAVLSLSAAACGSSDADDRTDGTDAPEATDAADTTGVAVTDVAETTAAPTTEALAATALNGLGELMMVRQVVADRGYFQIDESVEGAVFPVEARRLSLACADDGCTEVTATFATESADSTATATLTVDGTELSGVATQQLGCFTLEGTYDGPETTVATYALDLTMHADDSAAPWFSGTLSLDWDGEASDQCQAEDYGYDTEVIAFDPTTAPLGTLEDLAGEEVGVMGEIDGEVSDAGLRACEASDGPDCAVVLRRTFALADGTGAPMALDYVLAADPDGTYSGSISYPGPCVSDITGQFVADEIYDLTSTVTLSVFDLGRPTAYYEMRNEGTALASVPADQADQCGPFDDEHVFAGLSVDTPWPGWDLELRPASQGDEIDPALLAGTAPEEPATGLASQFNTGVEQGTIVDAEMLVRFLTYAAALNDEPETYGLRPAVLEAGVQTVGPQDPATSTAISAFGMIVDPGMPFAVLDNTGRCVLGAIASADGARSYLLGEGSADDCTAYAAVDALAAGTLSPIV